MNIPSEVIERALDATEALEPSYSEDLTEAVQAAAPIIAEWARKEALERAAVTAWTAGMDPLAGLVRAREFGSEIAFKIRALNDGGNP